VRYLELKSFYICPHLTELKNWHEFVQLVPVSESHANARNKIKQLLYSPKRDVHLYVGFYGDIPLFVMSFQKINQSAASVICLINKKHERSSVSFAKWIDRLDGVFRYLKIKEYSFKLKPNLIDTTVFFERIKSDKYFDYVKRELLPAKRGLVLGGGGARGAYQLGVWQHARERKWTYDVITGTSVGALNGALMIQDDWQSAEKLWHQIETKDVLALPEIEVENLYYFSSLLKIVQLMIQEAWKNKGISMQPLEMRIKKLLNTKKIVLSPVSFFVTTTHVKTFSEHVINIKNEPPEKHLDWLIASSSFFPALRPRRIEGETYIDGGYCNNIPVDIAVKYGVIDVTVIDVKGPGITKKYDVPLNITPLVLKSPWSLGNMLIFDTRRAKWNQRLGYLETKRSVEGLSGYWYTFDVPFMSVEYRQINRNIIQALLSGISISMLKKIKIQTVFEKLRILYQNEVSSYNLGWVVLELAGKYYEMDPSVCYTYESFCQKLLKKFCWYQKKVSLSQLYSLKEWLKICQNRFLLMGTHYQVVFWQQLLQNTKYIDKLSFIGLTGNIDIYFTARLIEHLRKNSERGI